ncbi:hypothetical protein HDV00_011986 [Rhizophlyctis rosea]|nr:hypothetical protein HDV00_011986 [Rhizophlyctis rosea]
MLQPRYTRLHRCWRRYPPTPPHLDLSLHHVPAYSPLNSRSTRHASSIPIPDPSHPRYQSSNEAWTDLALNHPLVHAQTGIKVYLVGVHHNSPASLKRVEEVIAKVKPQVVCLELDEDRRSAYEAKGAILLGSGSAAEAAASADPELIKLLNAGETGEKVEETDKKEEVVESKEEAVEDIEVIGEVASVGYDGVLRKRVVSGQRTAAVVYADPPPPQELQTESKQESTKQHRRPEGMLSYWRRAISDITGRDLTSKPPQPTPQSPPPTPSNDLIPLDPTAPSRIIKFKTMIPTHPIYAIQAAHTQVYTVATATRASYKPPPTKIITATSHLPVLYVPTESDRRALLRVGVDPTFHFSPSYRSYGLEVGAAIRAARAVGAVIRSIDLPMEAGSTGRRWERMEHLVERYRIKRHYERRTTKFGTWLFRMVSRFAFMGDKSFPFKERWFKARDVGKEAEMDVATVKDHALFLRIWAAFHPSPYFWLMEVRNAGMVDGIRSCVRDVAEAEGYLEGLPWPGEEDGVDETKKEDSERTPPSIVVVVGKSHVFGMAELWKSILQEERFKYLKPGQYRRKLTGEVWSTPEQLLEKAKRKAVEREMERERRERLRIEAVERKRQLLKALEGAREQRKEKLVVPPQPPVKMKPPFKQLKGLQYVD